MLSNSDIYWWPRSGKENRCVMPFVSGIYAYVQIQEDSGAGLMIIFSTNILTLLAGNQSNHEESL